jgi:hypothetical protein
MVSSMLFAAAADAMLPIDVARDGMCEVRWQQSTMTAGEGERNTKARVVMGLVQFYVSM